MGMSHQDDASKAPKGRSVQVSGQTIGVIVIVIVLVAFVLANRDEVKIDFLVFHINVALIWVLMGTALFGAAAGFLLGRHSRKD